MVKNILLIINPCAGKMKSKASLFDIINVFCKEKCNVVTQITQYAHHATDIAFDGAKTYKYDIIVCSGGDGTLNEVITGILKANVAIPIGYIPSGSTNDFATTMNIPLNIKKAATAIVNGSPHKTDIGILNGKYFSYVASFGAFTEASYNVPQSTKNMIGHLAYVFEGIFSIGNIQPYHVKIMANGTTFEDDYLFGAVANAFSIGGVVKMDNETVSMNDGKFEVLLVKNAQSPNDLSKIVKGLMNADYSDNIFEFFKASEIKFEMMENIDWSLDGEFSKGEKLIEVENIHEAITIIK